MQLEACKLNTQGLSKKRHFSSTINAAIWHYVYIWWTLVRQISLNDHHWKTRLLEYLPYIRHFWFFSTTCFLSNLVGDTCATKFTSPKKQPLPYKSKHRECISGFDREVRIHGTKLNASETIRSPWTDGHLPWSVQAAIISSSSNLRNESKSNKSLNRFLSTLLSGLVYR